MVDYDDEQLKDGLLQHLINNMDRDVGKEVGDWREPAEDEGEEGSEEIAEDVDLHNSDSKKRQVSEQDADKGWMRESLKGESRELGEKPAGYAVGEEDVKTGSSGETEARKHLADAIKDLGQVQQFESREAEEHDASGTDDAGAWAGGTFNVEPGAFHRWLGKSMDQPITGADIERGRKAGGHAARMANFAANARKWHHR